MSDKKHNVPEHLGIILDGNRRWAVENNVPKLEGHRRGYENLKEIAKYAFDNGVEYVSAFVFSTENWNRSSDEVDYLMKLLIWVAKNEAKELHELNIKIKFAGEEDRLSRGVLKSMRDAEELTHANSGGTLLLCLNYGGRQEIASAVNKILIDKPNIEKITPELIGRYLYSPEVPDVDMIIRTSGEQRLSNFMLWRAAYSELYFSEKKWPAFQVDDLKIALNNYKKRHRRFGR
ncbi:di-trans,poly-cis-decaprenylcistransferase [Candidatus Saccharibacteria bacterium]|nr:di-trans,poly-cis-decaprenylcistransferase [Candidatus Saccharibacteria bacterium]